MNRLATLLLFALAFPVGAGARVSEDYALPIEALSSAGGRSVSADFSQTTSFGEIGGSMSSADYSMDNGFIGQLGTVTVVPDLNVTTLAGSGPGSLRQAILDANTNPGHDTIRFRANLAGVIELRAALPEISGAVSIEGPGPEKLTVRPAEDVFPFRLFHIPPGQTAVISGLTLQGGLAMDGGAIRCEGNLTLLFCALKENIAFGGGGGAVSAEQAGEIAIADCTFEGNVAVFNGGAVQVVRSTELRIAASVFDGNSAMNGGALAFGDVPVHVSFSTLRNNVVAEFGGGIYAEAASDTSYTATLTRSTFTGNAAALGGGALFNAGPDTLLANCTFSANLANESGGAIRNGADDALLTARNCTITANLCGVGDSSGNGGGVFNDPDFEGTFTARNCIIAGNLDLGFDEEQPDAAGAFTSAGFNLVGAVNGATGFGVTGDILGTAGSPVDPLLRELANYGGPTLVHATSRGSPARDAGNVSGLGLTTDQRGHGRVVDLGNIANAPGSDGSDIGAFEFNPAFDSDVAPDLTVGEETTLTFDSDTDADAGTLVLTGGTLIAGGAARIIANDIRLAVATLSGVENLTFTGVWTLADDGMLTVENFTTIAGNIGELSAGLRLIKEGPGTLVLNGVNSYSGETLINDGIVVVLGRSEQSGFIIQNGATLMGNGVIGSLLVTEGGSLAPGISPGRLTAGATVWEGGGIYDWEINGANGVAGSAFGWDLLDANGMLTIAATPSAPFMIHLTTLSPPGNVPGLMAGFNPARDYAWRIASASGGIAGFSPDKFSVNAGDFANRTGGGSFSVAQAGNDLEVRFAAASLPPLELAILRGGAQVMVSWPAVFGDFVLQSSTHLADRANWTDVATVPGQGGDRLEFDRAFTDGQQFFRLRAP